MHLSAIDRIRKLQGGNARRAGGYSKLVRRSALRLPFSWRMILSENRTPLFGIMRGSEAIFFRGVVVVGKARTRTRRENEAVRAVSRTRCSAISAFTRVFDALWRCTAEPGPSQMRAFVTIPGLQRITSCCAAPGKQWESRCLIFSA